MAEVVPLPDALAELVHDGDSVALEGFTHLIPFAAGHELLRQGRRDLELIRMTPDLLYDQLIGLGAARKLVFSYGGNPGVGGLHRFRDAIEHGWPHPIELEEHSHAGMANRYAAGAADLPFAVMRGYRGTDLAALTQVAPITCPFTGEVLTAVPALHPDVAIVHAQESDRDGNVQLWGIPGVQKEAVLAAKRSLVTVERIVERLEPQPSSIVLPAWVIDAVAVAPGGSRPSYSLGITDRDNDFYRFWDELSRDRDAFTALDEGARAGAERGGGSVTPASAGEVQTVVAARRLKYARTVFIGVGRPSTAAILARMVHNPELVLVYESGTIGAKPFHVPLSIGDGELARTADSIVSVPEMFNYWIGPGRIDVAFLGAAQVDCHANLNSTVIGEYSNPKTRLPGAGGAPEIAASCGEVIVIVPHSKRTFVKQLDFCTTVGHGDGPHARERLGFRGAGPTAVITDLGVLEPDRKSKRLVLTSLHEGVDAKTVREATGWELEVADELKATEPPTAAELEALRELARR